MRWPKLGAGKARVPSRLGIGGFLVPEVIHRHGSNRGAIVGPIRVAPGQSARRLRNAPWCRDIESLAAGSSRCFVKGEGVNQFGNSLQNRLNSQTVITALTPKR